MTQVVTIRHDGLVPNEVRQSPFHIVGGGGVGSHVVQLLARMQLGLSGVTVYDGDIVEAHNPPSQQFTGEHIGQHKVQALCAQARIWSDDQIPFFPVAEMVTKQIACKGIVILCLDSMQSRRDIMRQSLFNNPDVSLVIETRMDATFACVYLLDPNNTSHQACWESTWYSDEDAENKTGCNGHYAIPTATSMTANLAVQQMLNYFGPEGETSTPNVLMLNLVHWRTTTRLWPKELLTE